jgi:hypothetical protein
MFKHASRKGIKLTFANLASCGTNLAPRIKIGLRRRSWFELFRLLSKSEVDLTEWRDEIDHARFLDELDMQEASLRRTKFIAAQKKGLIVSLENGRFG